MDNFPGFMLVWGHVYPTFSAGLPCVATSQVCRSQFFAGRLVWRPGASEEATKQATSAGLADVFQPSGAHSEARCPREHGTGDLIGLGPFR